MADRTFVSFSSADPIVCDTIVEAAKAAQRAGGDIVPWNGNDTSGRPIDRSVFEWIESAGSFIADVSEPNHNVTYEIGLAIGMAKPTRLIRAANKDRKVLEVIGLLHNIGHDDYANRAALTQLFLKGPSIAPWPLPKRNRDQPIYFVQSSVVDDLLSRVASGIKKTVKLRFRSFNPREIDRLTATEAFEQVAQSFGVLAVWNDPTAPEAFRQNQRAVFAIGLARGLEIPFLLFAHEDQRLPLDLDEIAARWSSVLDVDRIMRDFREQVYDAQEAFTETHTASARFLDLVHCGDPAAENEAAQLDNYFVETEQFRLTLAGELNIILGRKGSGKTAIFLQTRDRARADKTNIVVDVQPEGFQLVKLKEFVIKQLSHGARKEFIAAFWEYIIWLEIAYKLLEKDAKRVRFDSKLLVAYDRLGSAYKHRVEGSGDFSERLSGLTERIVSRYEMQRQEGSSELTSSKLLEVVYGSEIRAMRDEVLTYLKLKGVVFFLFDNLDRFWTPTGFADVDALIIIGLVESLLDIRRRLYRAKIDFFWAIFLRSDVYEFVIKSMADYGKLAVASAEWNDRELLARMFENRVLQGFKGKDASWRQVWENVSVQMVSGKSTLDFLLDASLMRPRYLIRLFETARRRAVTLDRAKIEEADYEMALDELGWQVLEDFDRELMDVVPDAEQLIFDLTQLGLEMSLSDLREVIKQRVNDASTVEAVIDVMIWTGCIGIRGQNDVTYISDCGFKRPFMRSLLRDEKAKLIVFHPTLASIISAPKQTTHSD
jgi:hypothetical protein